MGADVPANEGVASALTFNIPRDSLLAPRPPHAVAAGNVETSQRVVDTIWGALARALPDVAPAASQGTMNNLIIGGYDSIRGRPFSYYETIGGGCGGGPKSWSVWKKNHHQHHYQQRHQQQQQEHHRHHHHHQHRQDHHQQDPEVVYIYIYLLIYFSLCYITNYLYM